MHYHYIGPPRSDALLIIWDSLITPIYQYMCQRTLIECLI